MQRSTAVCRAQLAVDTYAVAAVARLIDDRHLDELSDGQVFSRRPKIHCPGDVVPRELQRYTVIDGTDAHKPTTAAERRFSCGGTSFKDSTTSWGTSRSVKRRTWRRRVGAHNNTGRVFPRARRSTSSESLRSTCSA